MKALQRNNFCHYPLLVSFFKLIFEKKKNGYLKSQSLQSKKSYEW